MTELILDFPTLVVLRPPVQSLILPLVVVKLPRPFYPRGLIAAKIRPAQHLQPFLLRSPRGRTCPNSVTLQAS